MSDIKKRIAVLGSTGSIGTQTLEVVRNNNDFIIDVLAADSSVEALEKQVREFSPRLVCVYKEEAAVSLWEILIGKLYFKDEVEVGFRISVAIGLVTIIPLVLTPFIYKKKRKEKEKRNDTM